MENIMMPFRSSATNIPSVKSSNKTAPPSTIRLQGWLNKQKHSKCKSRLRRYFVLYGEELRYYKNKNDTNALAVISLDHYSLVPDAQPLSCLNQKQWRFHTFCLVSDDETKFDWPDYFLQAENAEERQAWVQSLQGHVSQSKTVLEKWLERIELPQDDTHAASLYSRTGSDMITNYSSPTLPPAALTLNGDQLEQHQQLRDKNGSFASSIHLPPPQNLIRSHKSVESLSTFTTKSSTSSRKERRSSDFAPSRSSDSSNKLFPSKIFNWTRTKSSASSIASSSKSINNMTIEDCISSELSSTPITPLKPIEYPIIHPSEYNHDDDPSERITSLHQNSEKTGAATFYYDQQKLYQKETVAIA